MVKSQTPGQLLFAQMEIDLDEVPIEQLAEYTAVEYYLTVEDEPPSDAANIEKVHRYIEAFHHLCEVEAWEKAITVFSTRLDTPTDDELHNQLNVWGYYTEQVNVYNRLLGKFSASLDTIVLNGLSNLYNSLGDYGKAIEYQWQHLKIAREIGDRLGEGIALGSLGLNYYYMGNYPKAIECDRALIVATKIGIPLAQECQEFKEQLLSDKN
jgi:tetratricopeptide (TPR) repeat protein